jgi:hypothetical protein
MFKILILAYLIGQDPVDTQKTFVLDNNFETIEECKQELLLNTQGNNTYDVLYDFVVVNNFEYDWLMAGCKNEDTEEKFIIEPTYPEGKPDELKGIILDKNFNTKHIFEL